MNGPRIFQILHYLTPRGTDVYEEWLKDLDGRDAERIDAYVGRIYSGNFGMTRAVGEGVLELKIRFGSGYRVYYLHDGDRVVVLLCGGDKGSQVKDIARAKQYAADYWSRK